MPTRIPLASLLLVLALPWPAFASAADLPSDVLAQSQWTKLTRSDYDQALSRVPPAQREEFATNPKRVQTLLNNLLTTKTLAAQARVDGVRPAGDVIASSAESSEQALANAEIAHIESDAARAFDARRSDFEAKAREVYTLQKDKYRAPEEVRFSDIAVMIKDRGDDAALARAQEARRRVLAGEDFAAVALQYSDDPTTRDKGGALPFVSRDRLTKEFADGVFALERIGEVSEPIKGPTAYHVVRLEERHPARQRTFEEVREPIMADLRKSYIVEQRDARIRSIHRDPTLVVNQAAVDALVVPYDAAAAGRAVAPPTPPASAK